MNIKLAGARRTTINSVEVAYELDGTRFTVEWNNIHPGTGETGDFDLMLNVESTDEDLIYRVQEAIREGETDSNPDLELYLDIRDTFDSSDCDELINQ